MLKSHLKTKVEKMFLKVDVRFRVLVWSESTWIKINVGAGCCEIR
jgi:hypothetical protein